MANEAYRAVFLRVHPTGKMVLSLTTDSDGREAEYAQLVAAELGVPALDVKVVPADTDRFGTGHGFNTSPSDGTPAAIASATAKIRDKAQLLAGMALDAAPGVADVVQRRVGERRRERPDPGQDDRGRRAVRARHRRAAARASRAGSTPRPSTATEAGASTSSATFSAPNRPEYGFMPQSVCLTTATALSVPSPGARSNASGRVVPSSVSSPCDAEPPPSAPHARSSGT